MTHAAVALIKRFEGLELEAYRDIGGIWTIGYGHTSEGLKRACEALARGETPAPIECGFYDIDARGRVVTTEAGADALLRHDLRSREDAVARLVIAPLGQNAFDALVSLVYNIGIGAFQDSTVRRRINAGDTDERVAEAWGWWNKATVGGTLKVVEGLARRRAEEIALYLTPDPEPASAQELGLVAEPGKSGGAAERFITAPESEPSRGFFNKLISFLLKGRK